MSKRIALSSSNISVDLPSEINTTNYNVIADFEGKLEKYLGAKKHVVALNSGTSAIHLALILSGVTEGDEVLCQSFTYVATANPILYQKAKPVFIDSESDTWNICPKHLERAIKDRIANGKKPKAIIIVHLYGMPCKIEEIVAIAKKYQIILIEDAAEALGSMYKEQKCGTFGDFSIFSFNNNKIVSSFGGGVLICNSIEEKEEAIFLATQAKDKSEYYSHSRLGFNYRMGILSAFIGTEELSYLNDYVSARIANHQNYKRLLEVVKGVSLFKENDDFMKSNHWLSCILINFKTLKFTFKELRDQLEKDNIESRPLWKPLHLQPIFKNCAYYGGNVAENLFKKGLCLPSSANLTKIDFKRISNSIQKFL
ncbi:DegT/DnrJ/EryC1/StrS family aminotransferase [Polaribacter marinaquae]|uniref:Aminotransferase class I/II-fold pyridoxal phosphate-dependent enzyme n=1 Tax=Polaribacter marinaquae TaxID=1642819 RepID=A0ABZ2TVB4_9FLAO